MQYAAGILAHSAAACVFTTPTINGYKRYAPNSLAPDRAVWGRDNKGAMLRVIGAGADDPATHLENRVGEPAANPYLYMASQVLSGLDGMHAKMTPPAPSDDPYHADAAPLPANLMEALAALAKNQMFRDRLGDTFVDYILALKGAEVDRFFSAVTDWEHKEYFEMY
jgi:glutamine synthetase